MDSKKSRANSYSDSATELKSLGGAIVFLFVLGSTIKAESLMLI